MIDRNTRQGQWHPSKDYNLYAYKQRHKNLKNDHNNHKSPTRYQTDGYYQMKMIQSPQNPQKNSQQSLQFIQKYKINFRQIVEQLFSLIYGCGCSKNITSKAVELMTKIVQNNNQTNFGYEIEIEELKDRIVSSKRHNVQFHKTRIDQKQQLARIQTAQHNKIKMYDKIIEKCRQQYIKLISSIKLLKDDPASNNQISQQNNNNLLINGRSKGKQTQTQQFLHTIKSAIGSNNRYHKNTQQKLLMISGVLCYKIQFNERQKKNCNTAKVNKVQMNGNLASRYSQLFLGEVLDNCDIERQQLVDELERIKKASIKKTRLLYRYDSRIKQNIHMFIDDKPNILLLCKTKAEYLIAAYSSASFSKAHPSRVGNPAFIFSLTNQKSFGVVSGRKSICYDEHYVIFGNSEIRVNGANNKLLSNFGVSNSYYDSRDENVHTLLGQGDKREVEYQFLEIFQIVFQ